MHKKHIFPFSIFLLVISLFYGWTLAFEGNARLISFGFNILQILVGLTSLFLLLRASYKASSKQKEFWQLLAIGLTVHVSSNFYWLYNQISKGAIEATEISLIIWLLSYFFFLAALISKIHELSSDYSGHSHVFDIGIFMITVSAISFHYLINPVLRLSDESWLMTVTTVIYPIADLTIFFAITILYFILRRNKEQLSLLLCIAGFAIQIFADFFYAYVNFNNNYQQGHFVDLLWLVSILMIGFSGYFMKETRGDKTLETVIPIEYKEAIFPYLSVVILIALVAQSYQYSFNALSAGLLLAFISVLSRQFQILKRNRQLVTQYRHLAYHDPLTGLRNRENFNVEIERILTEYPEDPLALLLIDLDHFKLINDTMGHQVGDKVLISTARRLESSIDEKTLLFRLGGDEFIIIFRDASDGNCIELANRILMNFRDSLQINEHQINITPSIGISKYPQHGNNAEELMMNADSAMYVSKEKGKNGFSFFEYDLSGGKIRETAIQDALKSAIQKEQFQLHYQPKVDLQTNRITGMEALLRWHHPKLGEVSPTEFISLAEKTGQIVSIGEWVLREACRQNKEWQEKGFVPLSVSVNVSVLQFKHGTFMNTVRKVLKETNLDTQYLEIEITESIMQNFNESKKLLEALRAMGIKISIDDFGTGYSSLHVLQKLPIDTIKIDKTFVDEINSDHMKPMVKTIIDLGLNLNLSIVAEGIELNNQLKVLVEHGCTVGQGYLFSKPIPAKAFEELMLVNEMLVDSSIDSLSINKY